MAKYEALTRIGIPVHEERVVWEDIVAPVSTGETTYVEAGDTVTTKVFNDHYINVDKATACIADLVQAEALKEVS